MLLYFGVSGFYSFGEEEQIIDFRAKPRSRLSNTKYEDNFNLSSKYKPMKSAVFFGKNASGKTNLFMAIKTCISIIKKGFTATQVENEYFQNTLNQGCKSISFKLGISNKDNFFEFFIKFNQKDILEETLKQNGNDIYVFKSKKMLFGKAISSLFKDEELKILNDFFSTKSTESNLLKLKDFAINQIEDFLKCIDNIVIYMSSSYSKDYSMDFTESKKQYFKKNKNIILGILQIIDDSIIDFDFKQNNKEQKYDLLFLRANASFRFQIESEGIKKIIQLMSSLSDIIKQDKILIIDELDSCISTQALIRLFNEFINTEKNQAGQLIVSTHNILLFDITFLNSAQIFLITKDKFLCTQVRSYHEFDIRSEKKNAYLDYLKGSYDE
ncbi:AAA family ATPase [Helicobacter sp. 13S00477-4]|uniref:AAA family ATPase n=1 Tax=Helicobacter sp. 13S00477-4 TaxID=1905759 RepID=UPI000BA635A6|nr:AAA family ATPase [Helicobacter sp. 13S00477-4]PAF51992.1 hypothetical protein BKH44_04850 [Helicobacter sp. 13S00477-4]